MSEAHFFSTPHPHTHISNILELLMVLIGEVTTETVVTTAPQTLPSLILPTSSKFLHRNHHLPISLCLPDPSPPPQLLTPSPWLLVAPPCSLAPLTPPPHPLHLPSTYSRLWTLCCMISPHPLLLPLLFRHVLSNAPTISHSGKNNHFV